MTTGERLGTVSVGSCPTCHGPAQFVIPEGTVHAADCSFGREGLCNCTPPDVREVRLPNIDEDLGDGWKLAGIGPIRAALAPERSWRATAMDRDRQLDTEIGFGDSPSQAYLALRTAVEKRR